MTEQQPQEEMILKEKHSLIQKILFAVIAGILCIFLSKYTVFNRLGDYSLSFTWYMILLVLVAMVWGWRYGLLAGLPGVIYYSFVSGNLYGWLNVVTSIVFLCYFAFAGFITHSQGFKRKYLSLFSGIVFLSLLLYLVSNLVYGILLSSNPSLADQSIDQLQRKFLLIITLDSALNMSVLFLCADLLIRVNPIRKLFGLSTLKVYRNNLRIFAVLLLIFILAWLSFKGLSDFFVSDYGQLTDVYNGIVLLVFFPGSILVMRIIFHYYESQLKIGDILKESEGDYKILFTQANDPILILKEGIFVDCNSRLLEIFNASREEIIGKTPAFFSPEFQPDGEKSKTKARKLIEKANNGFPQRFEWQHQRPDGILFDVEVSLNRIDISEETIIQAILRDITEQKKNRELARKLSAAVEQSSASIIITDINGKIEYVNPKFCELTGFSCEEIIGNNPKILKSGHTTAEEYAGLWKTVLSGKVWKGEFKNLKKDGEEYWESASIAPVIDDSGRISHFVAIKDNITERKKIDQQLRDSEQKYRSIFENLIDVFYIAGLDGTIIEISPSINSYFGLKRENFIGKSVYDFYFDANEREVFISTLQKNGIINDYELAFTLGNNEKIYCSTNARIIFDEHGQPVHIEGMMRNITERKRIEEEIRVNEERFRKAQEAGKIGTFEYDIEKGIYWGSDEVKRIIGLDTNIDTITVEELRAMYVNREEFVSMQQSALKNQDYYDFIYEIARFNTKEIRTVHSIADIVRNDEGKAVRVIGILIDITERKQAEDKLQEKVVLLNNAQELALLGTYIIDLPSQTIHLSEEMVRLYAAGENAMSLPLDDYYKRFYHPDDIEKGSANTAYKNGKSFFIESRVVRGDGKVIWIQGNSTPMKEGTQMFGVVQDITERKKAENALRTSEEQFRAIFERSTLGKSITLPDGRFTMVNQAFAEMTGYTIDELVNLNFAEITHPDDIDISRESIRCLMAKEQDTFRFEKRYIHKKGKTVWTDVNTTLIRDESGNPSYFITNITDITERKELEQELIAEKERAEKNEFKLKEAQGLAKIGNWELDILHNKLYWSDEIYRIFDCVPDEFEATYEAFLSFIHPDDRDFVNDAYLSHINTQAPYNIVHRIVLKNGTVKYVNERCKSDFDSDGKAIRSVGTVADITERILIENELKEAKEKAEENGKKLNEANEIAKLGSWELDINSGIFTFTDNFYKIFHTNAIEMGGYQMSIEDYSRRFVHPDDASMVGEETKKAIETGDPGFSRYVEHRIFYHDGGTGYIGVRFFIVKDKSGKTIKTYGVNQDITERKIAEQELVKAKEKAEESESHFRTIAEQSTEGITVADLDGKFIYVNSKFCEMSGYTREELLNLTVFDMGRPEFQEIEKKIYYSKENVSGNKHNVVLRKKDGTPYFTEITGTNIIINNQKLVLGSIRDVTEIINYQSELIAAKEKAEESDRLKSAFLANMSHEIRTPMNGILGFASLLKEPDLSGENQSEYIDLIEKSGERMLNIIQEIIDISKIESGQMKVSTSEMNVNEQIKDVFDLFRYEAERKKLKFDYKNGLPDNLSIINTDEEKLYSILTNLVKNAIKYTDKGSIEFGYSKEGTFLQFYIKDTGIGINEDRHNAIFDRFIQEEIIDVEARQGAGLGLAIAKAFTEMLGGKIWLTSKKGEGSTFYFTIPYNLFQVDVSTETADTKLTHADNEDSQLKILIVEDDETSQVLLSMIIKDIASEILQVSAGLDAVEMCRSNPDIDLVLMDIQLPGINGYEATRQIREFNKDVVIIAQTAFAQVGDDEKALEAGCNGYIAKPFNSSQLIAVIRKFA